ncbi:helix-turn-helix domain-containing protein [Staphylococcus epidermidis]|uniref:helix-turn-helix transcriptional regulator n=1 Tax=Staphylococcus epidermidis TaxID=1282 RepID=UPI0020966D9A|nr:helix-turn-helix transcriptional regulator [Staphylococcus epidermidis]MCG2181425.1 helix-turn-helix domain-containing protein [Staphylococcus epidermidis]MCO6310333.1 helix-turn-helix domain-containing protein [Staphylococcus epidermidis]
MPEQLSVRKWRLIRDLKQQEVADILGVNSKTVGHWEKEDTNLSNVTVYALAKLYDIEVDQIKV